MTLGQTGRKRRQFSVRSLLILTGVTAILLAPVAWVARRAPADDPGARRRFAPSYLPSKLPGKRPREPPAPSSSLRTRRNPGPPGRQPRRMALPYPIRSSGSSAKMPSSSRPFNCCARTSNVSKPVKSVESVSNARMNKDRPPSSALLEPIVPV